MFPFLHLGYNIVNIVTSDDGEIIIYYNNFGVFSDAPLHINDNLDCYPKDIVATDLNKDNYPELIIANFNRPNFILENKQGQINPIPVWKSNEVDPTINVRIFDNGNDEKLLLFGKSRGGKLEFYKVECLCPDDTIFESLSICEGESYEGWTETGQYSRTLTSVTGCDKVLIIYILVSYTENIYFCDIKKYTMKTVSLKIDDSIFGETEKILARIKIPRNRYINDALNHYNRIQNRQILEKKLKLESELVKNESLNTLKDFERIDYVD